MGKDRHVGLLHLILSLSFLLLTACSGGSSKGSLDGKDRTSPYKDKINTLENIWMEIKDYTITPTGLEVVFRNTSTQDSLYFGAWFVVEELRDEQWLMIDCKEGSDKHAMLHWARSIHTEEYLEQARNAGELWTELAFEYLPNEMIYYWEPIYGKLAKGEYRIVVEVGGVKPFV